MTQPAPQVRLDYEGDAPPPAVSRPAWVWVVVGTYVLLFGCILLFPIVIFLTAGAELLTAASLVAAVLTVCGLGLIFAPVRAARRRPLTRRSVLIPLICSGFLLGSLFLGVLQAIGEWIRHEELIYAGLLGGSFIWVVWTAVWWYLTRRHDPGGVAARLHKWLLGGSVAELLVAVPTHLVVRRREECCAGMLTGTAICMGVVVMFVAFGPSVVLLYFKRAREITPPTARIAQS